MNLKRKILTIELLEELRSKNFESLMLYQNAGMRNKKLMLKNFFFRLSKQKEQCLREMEKLIKELQKQVYEIGKSNIPDFKSPKKTRSTLPPFYLPTKDDLQNCLVTEKNTLDNYISCLSKINDGRIRETLMCHRHKIKEMLLEMNIMGANKYPV
ncbi:hypothetical protein RM553_01495 [Zunongwangia sp. F363]|uniref:Uncharacterized protein n=1 Tax=Autumnicola tepida TaxID=3075595 RepID=A0ABU3C585_9FLAO|nr:hypothetical protein [Zunongwangia sp. F363]MDT0641494.1 hypothetical protein [Zunongwangia sp. F363]